MPSPRRSTDTDQDLQLKERFFQAARDQMAMPDPCGGLTIAAVADASAIAASTILDQLPVDVDTPPVRHFHRLVFAELLDRLRPAPVREMKHRVVSGLSRGEGVAELAPALVEMVVDQFVDDPSARYLMAAKARADEGLIAEAMHAAWDRLVVPVADLIEVVAAADGLVLGAGLTASHLDDVVALNAATGYLWRHSYPKQALDYEPASAVGSMVLALLEPMLVRASFESPVAHAPPELDRNPSWIGRGRTRHEASTVERAVSAGADLVLAMDDDEPVLPSGSALCRQLGIGASTFQRLFGSADGFRHDFVLWFHVNDFPDVRASVAGLFNGGGPYVTLDWLLEWGIGFMREFGKGIPDNPPELVFFPWHDHPVVAGCLASEFLESQRYFLPLAEGLLRSVDPQVLASVGVGEESTDPVAFEDMACRLVNRVLASNIAGGFLPDRRAGREWPLAMGAESDAVEAVAGRELLPIRYFMAAMLPSGA